MVNFAPILIIFESIGEALAIVYENISFGIEKLNFGPILTEILRFWPKFCDHRTLKRSYLGQFWSDFNNFWSECVSLAIVYENISFGIKKSKFGPILTKFQKSNPARLCLTFCDHRAVLRLFKQVRVTKITI